MTGLCSFSSSVHYIHGQDRQDSSSTTGVTFGECNVWCLLFADDLTLLSSKRSDLQYAFDWFSNTCLDAGMKISMIKTEITCLSRHPVQCSFQTNRVTLKQTEKLKYLGVTFSSDGRQATNPTHVFEKQVQ